MVNFPQDHCERDFGANTLVSSRPRRLLGGWGSDDVPVEGNGPVNRRRLAPRIPRDLAVACSLM